MAELGFTVECTDTDLRGTPIRLVEGQLTFQGGGPLLQADLSDGKLILSDKIVAKGALGAGVSVTEDRKMGISRSPLTGFAVQGGWLVYNYNPIFYALNSTVGWRLYTNISTAATPIMLQAAQIVYPDSTTSTSRGTSTDESIEGSFQPQSVTRSPTSSYLIATKELHRPTSRLTTMANQIEYNNTTLGFTNITLSFDDYTRTGVYSTFTSRTASSPSLTTVVRTVYQPPPTVFHTTSTITVTAQRVPVTTVTKTVYRVLVTVTESPSY